MCEQKWKKDKLSKVLTNFERNIHSLQTFLYNYNSFWKVKNLLFSKLPGSRVIKNWGMWSKKKTTLVKQNNNQFLEPVDGHWNRWSSWSDCSKECGTGKTSRTRKCNDPEAKNGGKVCEGKSREEKSCFIVRCGLRKWKAAKQYMRYIACEIHAYTRIPRAKIKPPYGITNYNFSRITKTTNKTKQQKILLWLLCR